MLAVQHPACQVGKHEADTVGGNVQPDCFSRLPGQSQRFCPPAARRLQFPLFFHKSFCYQFFCDLRNRRQTQLQSIRNIRIRHCRSLFAEITKYIIPVLFLYFHIGDFLFVHFGSHTL